MSTHYKKGHRIGHLNQVTIVAGGKPDFPGHTQGVVMALVGFFFGADALEST